MTSIHHATVRDVDPVALYRILQLRTEVFIHEQGIVGDQEIDGRDLEPTTTLFWAEDDGRVVSTLRLLQDELPAHIGRVATATSARGRGVAAEVMRAAMEYAGTDIAISAQAYLEEWYGRFGFVRTGANYLEAGIDHVPMLFTRA
ncbi:acetyltransferase [Rhodococcus sp. Leaf7]|uniref:GNAT family N-acetyltransferase n=1 Tax=unclassified Rhodococcus (in: high G+C Gram-positive bacteria) TaxID=192944 RepID=UPI0006F2D7E6|nr:MULTISPECIES: GNAT family N-acetyltransferase [unclassified Rhodococcus (in: high G+C Gram-positive bacteria)]KQU04499.1 acetyltransferase [Rhodococcus sp. Leaf7]KQU40684.1 acetyltransferase [Rhodococcus sp. Leaf247]